MTKVFYKTVLQENPALRRAEVRDATVLEQINGAAAAVPASHVGLYALAMQRVKPAQQELRKVVPEQQDKAEPAEETAEVMSDMVALPGEASQGEALVLAQASQAPQAAPAANSTSSNAAVADGGFTAPWLIAGLAGFGVVLGGGSSSSTTTVVESDEHVCDLEVSTPTRPSSTGAMIFSAGPGGEDFDTLVYSAGDQSIILTAAMLGAVSAVITSEVDIGDIYASAGASGQILATVDTTRSVGDIALLSGEGTSGDYVQLSVSAGDDVGDVSFILNGVEAAGTLYVEASGGDIGSVSILANNSSGSAYAYISAFAAASGDDLLGGNVGDIKVKSDLEASQVDVLVYASGGDVGRIDVCMNATESSGRVTVSALAQVNGLDEVVGGNVGDIVVNVGGGSAGAYVEVTAVAATGVSGIYLGGGNIGDLVLTVHDGVDDGAFVSAFATGGGSIGSIDVTTSGGLNASASGFASVDNGGDVGDITILTLGSGSVSASAAVELSLAGTVSNYSEVGDITLNLYGGQNNSAGIEINTIEDENYEIIRALYARIGDITAVNHGGGSGEIDIKVWGGSGSVIGNVSLTDNGRFSVNQITLAAEESIGNVTAAVGGGDGKLFVNIQSQLGSGSIGIIDIDVASDNFASESDAVSGGHAVRLDFRAASGTTVSDISISGGTEFASLSILANESGVSEVIGDLELSGFDGFSFVDVSEVLEGVRIDVSQGGSLIIGTEGSDDIYLGDGDDTINFGYFESDEGTDDVFNYETGVDALDVFDTGSTVFVDLIGNTATTLVDGSVVSLLDLSGGDILSTELGLRTALNSGEYALVDSAVGGGTFTFVTAASDASDSFNVFEVSHDGTEYTTAYLMATVDFKTGSTFGDLTASDFI